MGSSPSRSASATPAMQTRDETEAVRYPEVYKEPGPSSHAHDSRHEPYAAGVFGQAPPRNANQEEVAPLGYWMGLEAWRKTTGIASIDLRRPTLPGGHAGDSLFQTAYPADAPTHPAAPTAGRRNPFMTSGARATGAYNNGYEDSQSRLGGAFPGARCKILRCVEWGGPGRGPNNRVRPVRQPGSAYDQAAGQRVQNDATLTAGDVQTALTDVGSRLSASLRPIKDAPLANFGVGASFELDKGQVQPICRLKIKDFLSIKLLPRPILKLHKRFPLGRSGLAIRVAYDCPLEDLDNAFQPPARLLVRLDNQAGSGIHVGPSGVEIDERVLALGANAEARFGASVAFPRQLPIMRDQHLFDWDIHRLGIKTRW